MMPVEALHVAVWTVVARCRSGTDRPAASGARQPLELVELLSSAHELKGICA